MQRAILGQLGHPVQEAKDGARFRRQRGFPVSRNFADTSSVCFRFLRKYTLNSKYFQVTIFNTARRQFVAISIEIVFLSF
jgi:hypothetical protein